VQDGIIPYIPGEGEYSPWLFDVHDLDTYIESHKTIL